ncbi:MAG: type II secretion system protein [Actinomycetota bacterium]
MKKSKDREGEAGFSLVELLVVIVIISILAAIAIPVFFAQRDKGLRAQVVSGLKNAATTMQGWGTENDGDYEPEPPGDGSPGNELGDMAWLKDRGWRAAQEVTLDILRADENGFCLTGTHDALTSIQLEYRSNVGLPEDGDCT